MRFTGIRISLLALLISPPPTAFAGESPPASVGMMRSAPSGQPMYQSGCEPADTIDGS
jgi:hypothetical protein